MGRRYLEPVVTDKRNVSVGQKALVLPQASPLLHPGQAFLLTLALIPAQSSEHASHSVGTH